MDGHPRLGLALSLAYRSLILQTMLAVILLGFSGRLRALRDFVLAFALAGTVTVLVSALPPALANFVFLGLSPADFPNLHPAASYVHVADLTGLRDGTLRTINLDHVEGIITFPSFHAALGGRYIWAFWSLRAAAASPMKKRLSPGSRSTIPRPRARASRSGRAAFENSRCSPSVAAAMAKLSKRRARS